MINVTLTGSEKQIKWAQDIIATINAPYAYPSESANKMLKHQDCKGQPAIDVLLAIKTEAAEEIGKVLSHPRASTAVFWIDNFSKVQNPIEAVEGSRLFAGIKSAYAWLKMRGEA